MCRCESSGCVGVMVCLTTNAVFHTLLLFLFCFVFFTPTTCTLHTSILSNTSWIQTFLPFNLIHFSLAINEVRVHPFFVAVYKLFGLSKSARCVVFHTPANPCSNNSRVEIGWSTPWLVLCFAPKNKGEKECGALFCLYKVMFVAVKVCNII